MITMQAADFILELRGWGLEEVDGCLDEPVVEHEFHSMKGCVLEVGQGSLLLSVRRGVRGEDGREGT